MPRFQQFLEHNATWLLLLWAACFAFALARRCSRYKRHGVTFPDVASQRVRFDESAASGASLRSLWTRLGGAQNCLRVTVTDAEVWIRPPFPFVVLAQDLDLVHRIPRSAVTSVRPRRESGGRSLLLEYSDAEGGSHRFVLRLRDPAAFLAALASDRETG